MKWINTNAMINNKRIVALLLYILVPCQIYASETDSSLQQKQDSLLNLLSEISLANQKIDILESLALLYTGKQESVEYWSRLIDIADEADSLEISYRAMVNIGRYYAIIRNTDSLLYWSNKLDSVGKQDSRAVEYQFQIYNYLCRVYMSSEDMELELAMNIAVSQRLLAEKTGSQNGLILSSENLGLIYMLCGRYEDAVSSFNACLSLLNRNEGRLDLKLQVAESLIRTYIYQAEFGKAGQLLEYYEKNLIRIESIDKIQGYDSEYSRCFLYSYRIWLYSAEGKKEKALQAIKDLESYRSSLRGFASAINKFAMGHYFLMIKDYDRALGELKPIEEGDDEVLKLKIDILKAKGDKTTLLEANRQLLDLYKNKNTKAYLRQVDQLRSLQQLNEQEKQKQILFAQKQVLKNKQTQLIFLTVCSTILLVVLILLIRYSIRTRRLKNALEQEQMFLKDTNRNLEIAKDKAEKADRMKSSFIANISHEIRTPLNTIVDVAELLKDSTKEACTEYVRIINNNSDLMLNLVNDVLDLSSMEDDNFTLHLQPVDIQECCRHALDMTRHRINPNINVIFTHPEFPLITNSDPFRLEQLLTNLLINAAKFTEQGEICLDYKVNRETGEIVFSVTDTAYRIPSDKQDLIFNNFEKVNDFKQRNGLGLSVCKAISQHLGGKLHIDVPYPPGVRFVFVLPGNT